MHRSLIYSYYYGQQGGEALPEVPTEQELYTYIMANFPPDFLLDPEQGIVDSSGNGVTITQNGAPTLNASGGLNDKAYISLDGVDDALIVNRVDIGTHAFVFRHNNTGQMLLNVPTSDTGTGDTPKFFKAGFQWNNGSTYYAHLPASGGTLKGARSAISATSSSWRNFLCRGEGYIYNHGRSVFNSKLTAVAATTVTKMFYGCWGRGDGANLANFTAYDIGLSMIWNEQLTDAQMYIVHAYLEKRFASYGNLTYQYKPVAMEIEATNPIFDGNSNSESTKDQAYAGNVIPEGYAIMKGLSKGLYGFSSVDPDLLTWTDQAEVIPGGSFGEFDVDGANIGLLFKEGSTYNIVYGGRSSGNYQIGLATSSSPISGYTKYASNPIVTLASVNTALSKAYTLLYPTSLVKISGTYYLFMNALQSGINACDIVMVSGASLTTLGSPSLKLTQADSPIKDGLLYTAATRDDTGWPEYARYTTLSGVHLGDNGKYQGFFSVSNIFGDALTNERSQIMFAAVADDENFNWKVVGSGILIDTGGPSTWNKTQSYLGQIMVAQDGAYVTPVVHTNGKWLITFAGLGTTAEAINTHGMTGFAYAPKKLVDVII